MAKAPSNSTCTLQTFTLFVTIDAAMWNASTLPWEVACADARPDFCNDQFLGPQLGGAFNIGTNQFFMQAEVKNTDGTCVHTTPFKVLDSNNSLPCQTTAGGPPIYNVGVWEMQTPTEGEFSIEIRLVGPCIDCTGTLDPLEVQWEEKEDFMDNNTFFTFDLDLNTPLPPC